MTFLYAQFDQILFRFAKQLIGTVPKEIKFYVRFSIDFSCKYFA